MSRLLYLGQEQREGFLRSLCGLSDTYRTHIEPPFYEVDSAKAVVLVENQRGVFSTGEIYEAFIRCAKMSGTRIGAILSPGETLPGKNFGVDFIFRNEEHTIREIRSTLLEKLGIEAEPNVVARRSPERRELQPRRPSSASNIDVVELEDPGFNQGNIRGLAELERKLKEGK